MQSSDAAIVFVTGLRTEKRYFPWDCRYSSEIACGSWTYYLRKAGWKGAIYHFWWDSGRKWNIEVADWKKSKRRADLSGTMYLEKASARTVKESSVSLFGHSLGARVIYAGSSNWASQTNYKLRDIVLLGGAAHRMQIWECVASRITGNVFNVYNLHDPILNTAYRAVSSFSPCGIKPIRSSYPKIKNIDVTCSLRASHGGKNYLKALFNHIDFGHDANVCKKESNCCD